MRLDQGKVGIEHDSVGVAPRHNATALVVDMSWQPMPGPQHKLLQLGHDNAVVNLVPTIHNQVASHGIHGIEFAAGVGGTQHRLVVGSGSNRMCEAGNGRIARARSVNGGDIGGLGAERSRQRP